MRKVFASIAHPKQYAYEITSDSYYGQTHPVSGHFRMFETYGDGLTQHSGAWSIPREHLTDYLFSLAAAMQTDAEIRNQAHYELRAGRKRRQGNRVRPVDPVQRTAVVSQMLSLEQQKGGAIA